MCNLYRLHTPRAAIAQLFEVPPGAETNRGDEVYPGYPGLVVADGALRTMTWGFPLVLKGRQGQALKPKPVTNARDDKLDSAFWRDSFRARRCLIPLDAWAEPEGAARRMTRTWYAPEAGGPFAVAGLWRASEAWGDVYAMVMTEAAPAMADVHDRMPVILHRADWAGWTGADDDAAKALVKTWTGPLQVDRTPQLWSAQGPAAPDLFVGR